jgi:YesN/AraC family two-component response regulator
MKTFLMIGQLYGYLIILAARNLEMPSTKVVIFEDEFLLANDLKRQLAPYEYEVIAMFRKAEEGLEYLAGIQNKEIFPEVVLMDISLAGKMTGIEAADIISQKYNVALVFLTGMNQFEVFEESFKTRPCSFLNKPFDIQQALINITLAVYQKTLENKLLKNQEDFELRINERTQELLEAKTRAEEAIRAKNMILESVSNQIREPMLGIMGFSAILKQKTKDQPEIHQLTQYVDDNASHLYTLLNKVMELTNEPTTH